MYFDFRAQVHHPALAMFGGKSPTWMQNAVTQVSQTLPNAGLRVLDGQTHMIKASVLAPVVAEFFTGQSNISR